MKVFALGAGAGLLCLLLHGCIGVSQSPEPAKPFQFRSLTLRQNDEAGEPLWELRSPRSRYQLDNRQAVVTAPVGVLYRKGEPAYRLSAPKGLLIRDGEQVELIDGVHLRALDGSGLVITGNRAVWTPNDDLLVLQGSPKAEDPQQLLTAKHAQFDSKLEQLQLRDNLVLRRWNKGQSHREPATLLLRSPEADWNLKSGALTVAGPVKGVQRPEANRQRLLSASALTGNTTENWIDFEAPVTVDEAAEGLTLRAGKTRWWTQDNRLSSSAPAQGTFKKLTASGGGFELWDQRKELLLTSDCQLQQPDQSLNAKQCRWNWDTGELMARGSVELRREQLNQLTRAEVMQGFTGEDGQIRFTAPGSRVQTRLEFDQPDSAEPSDRNQAAPVQF